LESTFFVYLHLGFDHISDLRGYDHILFVLALCAAYSWSAWKELLWLVTAFTVGHSVTLALATLEVVSINGDLVEFLIPVTIFATSLVDIMERPDAGAGRTRYFKYSLALGFGLIHGLGFSNFLRAVLGGEESILLPLFAFNVGLEIGQLLIVLIALSVTLLMIRVVRMKQREWMLVLAGGTAGMALTMIVEKLLG